MFQRLRLISAALYVCRYVMTLYLTTWECSHQTRAVQHGDINASTHAQSVMGPECSNDHKGRGLYLYNHYLFQSFWIIGPFDINFITGV